MSLSQKHVGPKPYKQKSKSISLPEQNYFFHFAMRYPVQLVFKFSMHKSFLNQTTCNLRKTKWSFLYWDFSVLVCISLLSLQEAVLYIYEISPHSCFFLVYSRHDFHCEIQACLWRCCHSCSGKQQEVGRLLIGVFWQYLSGVNNKFWFFRKKSGIC